MCGHPTRSQEKSKLPGIRARHGSEESFESRPEQAPTAAQFNTGSQLVPFSHAHQEDSMNEVSRRSFLKGGSAAMVAAGAISAIPGLPAVVGALEAQGPADAGAADAAAGAAVTDADSSSALSEPLVAHVRDLATGEIGLFSGAREITVLDPQLAARLIRAAQ
jgi:hypothetical protein